MRRSRFPQVITVMGEALIDIIVDGEGEVAAAAIAAGVNVQRLPCAGSHGHGLMAKAAEGGVFRARVAGVGWIDFHHPAVLVASQAKGIAQPIEPFGLTGEWPR